MTMLDSAGRIKPLVERLRQIAQEGREIIEPWQLDPHLYDEAADEIERLRAALAEIIELKGEDMYHAIENSMAAAIARDALEQTRK